MHTSMRIVSFFPSKNLILMFVSCLFSQPHSHPSHPITLLRWTEKRKYNKRPIGQDINYSVGAKSKSRDHTWKQKQTEIFSTLHEQMIMSGHFWGSRDSIHAMVALEGERLQSVNVPSHPLLLCHLSWCTVSSFSSFWEADLCQYIFSPFHLLNDLCSPLKTYCPEYDPALCQISHLTATVSYISEVLPALVLFPVIEPFHIQLLWTVWIFCHSCPSGFVTCLDLLCFFLGFITCFSFSLPFLLLVLGEDMWFSSAG